VHRRTVLSTLAGAASGLLVAPLVATRASNAASDVATSSLAGEFLAEMARTEVAYRGLVSDSGVSAITAFERVTTYRREYVVMVGAAAVRVSAAVEPGLLALRYTVTGDRLRNLAGELTGQGITFAEEDAGRLVIVRRVVIDNKPVLKLLVRRCRY